MYKNTVIDKQKLFFNHPAEDEEMDDEETDEPAQLTYDSLFKIKE